MNTYITKSSKSEPVQKIINEAIEILDIVGIPLVGKKERALERMAIAFLAVAGIETNWKQVRNNTNLKTRDVISFINEHFEENISPGSYDDIRRKDLKLLVLADLVVNSGTRKGSVTNDPTRGYALHPDFYALLLTYATSGWEKAVSVFNAKRKKLSDQLTHKRDILQVPVKLLNGQIFELLPGEHNTLQKAIIEDFLPRFGEESELLYVGDTAKKLLHIEKERLKELQCFDIYHDELPDIIAYSQSKNWLYLIEAVHSSGPMNETRVLKLKQKLTDCKADIIFITAFLTKADFKKWILEVAWETEVWIADNPDHMIHFNGSKFLGPF